MTTYFKEEKKKKNLWKAKKESLYYLKYTHQHMILFSSHETTNFKYIKKKVVLKIAFSEY